jgi:DNA-directed RNA polymerase sigma subunit (sigma70/sigma32)
MMATNPALHLVARKAARISDAERERDEAIRAAFSLTDRHLFGYTVEDIAEAAGLTRERIYQIVKETR